VTPRIIRRVLLPLSFAIFFGSLVIAAAIYFRGRPFDVRDAIISDLESPEDNPRGYAIAAVGTALCGILLLPAARFFYMQLREMRRRLAFAGTVLFVAGLASAITMALLAPFTRDYTPLHVQLAFGAFMGICSGSLIDLIVLATTQHDSSKLRVKIVLDCSVFAFLLYFYFTPHFFDNRHVLTSLAFWEWLLCFNCVASIAMLAATCNAPPEVISQASSAAL